MKTAFSLSNFGTDLIDEATDWLFSEFFDFTLPNISISTPFETTESLTPEPGICPKKSLDLMDWPIYDCCIDSNIEKLAPSYFLPIYSSPFWIVTSFFRELPDFIEFLSLSFFDMNIEKAISSFFGGTDLYDAWGWISRLYSSLLFDLTLPKALNPIDYFGPFDTSECLTPERGILLKKSFDASN